MVLEVIRSFFESEANRIVLNFVHGLVFLLLGFAVFLKTKRWSELTLARGLPYLGLFGVLNAFGDWGHVFVPIQETVFSERVIGALWILDTAILALSYVFLMLFGLRLAMGAWGSSHPVIRALPRAVWGLYALWLGTFLAAMRTGVFDAAEGPTAFLPWEIAFRYAFAFPGSLLSAWGLSLQEKELERLDLHESVPPLKWVGYALLLHGTAAGLFVPELGTIPANWLNEGLLLEATGLPVRFWSGLSGFVAGVFMVASLNVFDEELGKRLEKDRRDRALLEERVRIARDLHDGVIQTLYALGLHLERVFHVVENIPEELKTEIRQVMKSVDGAITEVRGYISRLKRSGEPVHFYEELRLLVRQLQGGSAVPIHLETEGVMERDIDPALARDLLNIAREAVSNALRHAHPTRVVVRLSHFQGGTQLVVQDDGTGFDPSRLPASEGNQHQGIANMRARAAAHGGTLTIESTSGQGTSVIVRILTSSAQRPS